MGGGLPRGRSQQNDPFGGLEVVAPEPIPIPQLTVDLRAGQLAAPPVTAGDVQRRGESRRRPPWSARAGGLERDCGSLDGGGHLKLRLPPRLAQEDGEPDAAQLHVRRCLRG